MVVFLLLFCGVLLQWFLDAVYRGCVVFFCGVPVVSLCCGLWLLWGSCGVLCVLLWCLVVRATRGVIIGVIGVLVVVVSCCGFRVVYCLLCVYCGLFVVSCSYVCGFLVVQYLSHGVVDSCSVGFLVWCLVVFFLCFECVAVLGFSWSCYSVLCFWLWCSCRGCVVVYCNGGVRDSCGGAVVAVFS